jgi:mannose-6-phosphate isomerase-like protein (cupin superfamily)
VIFPNITREWGSHRILEDQPLYKIKELILRSGKSLPIKQYPMNKHWFVLKGECIIETVYLDDPQHIAVIQGHSYGINAGVWHLAKNISIDDCHILEVRYLST